MASQIERISPVECRVRVEIAWPQVSAHLSAKMKDLRKRAKIPGFRSGKVPPHMVEKLFGKGVREEVARDLVEQTFEQEVTKQGQRPLTQPVVESANLVDGEDFVYTARFEVPPVIEPGEYTGLAVKRRIAVATDEQVDAELQKKRLELARFEPIAADSGRTTTAAGDVWTIDIEGNWADQPVSRKDLRVEIGSSEQEYIPGLSVALEKLELAAAGSTKEITFLPPQDNLVERFQGQEVKMSVGLRDVKAKILPELDDEFARDTGEAESFEELKQKIKDQLIENDKMLAERDARLRLMGELLKRTPVTPAPSMVTNECAAQVQLLRQQLAQQGMPLEALGRSEAQLRESIRPRAHANVSAFLLLDAIARKESIEVTEEEIVAEVALLAEEQNANPQKLRAQMEKNNQILLLRAQIREDKIFQWLMEKSDVTEVPAEELAATEEDPGVGPLPELAE